MAHYDQMNDPMEGAFLIDSANQESLKKLYTGKRKKLICSFSKDYRHTLLWSHYADSHQGCCLEVEVTSKMHRYEVNYSSTLPKAKHDDVIQLLTHKSQYWDYEKECRYIKDDVNDKGNKTRPFLSIKISKIFLGIRMPLNDVRFYTSLIHSILGNDIEVRQIKKEELDTGYIRQQVLSNDLFQNN